MLQNDEYIPQVFRSFEGRSYLKIDRPNMKLYELYGLQDMVLKILICEDEERFRRAVRECQTTDELRGKPGLVWLLDYITDQEQKTVGMLEEKETPLDVYLGKNLLSRTDIVRIGTGLMDSLLQLKADGYLHLDVHPGNVYFDGVKVKLGDFGSALKKSEAENFHELTGVKKFMAPEVWHEQKYSEQSDIYSSGMILYWILNHCKPPFLPAMKEDEAFACRMAGESFPVPQCMLKYPGELLGLYQCIEKMTAYDPGKRYETFEEVRKDLAICGYDYFTEPSQMQYAAGIYDIEHTIPPFPPFQTIGDYS